jgi:hypothetical protein
MRTRHTIWRVAAVLLVALLATAGCGDDSDDAGTQPRQAESSAGADSGSEPDDTGSDSGELDSYELHPDLANIPLPEGYVVPVAASAYSEDESPRATVTQNVHLTQAHDEAFEFFLDALPAAGFTVDDNAAGGLMFFENPDGIPGQLTVMPMPDGGSNVVINLHRAG